MNPFAGIASRVKREKASTPDRHDKTAGTTPGGQQRKIQTVSAMSHMAAVSHYMSSKQDQAGQATPATADNARPGDRLLALANQRRDRITQGSAASSVHVSERPAPHAQKPWNELSRREREQLSPGERLVLAAGPRGYR